MKTISSLATHNSRPLSRRSFLRAGAGLAALAGLRPSADLFAAPGPPSATSLPALPASPRTWLLRNAHTLRPAAPAAPTSAEMADLLRRQDERTDATIAQATRWASGPAVLPWTDVTLDLIRRHKPSPARAARALALVHAAAADVETAARDARLSHPRPAPAAVVPGLVSLASRATPDPSSFPSVHAAVAAAVAPLLTALFPKEPAGEFARLSQEALAAPLDSGFAFDSDIAAGREIGEAIAALAIERSRADGSDAVWDGTLPADPGLWQPTPPAFIETPLDPLAGTWRTWVLGDPAGFRPEPPPAVGSPTWEAELAAVQAAVATRTPEQEAAVHFWAGGPGTVTPAGLWIEIARDLIRRDERSGPRAAHVLALTSIALADAFVCCWDAKYTYWTARPITADPTLDVLIPTPPFPSFTSGHSTISAAAATVLATLFPADASNLLALAAEAKDSRLWAGIHFPMDNTVGANMGASVGRIVLAAG